jgi:hypothetical protein
MFSFFRNLFYSLSIILRLLLVYMDGFRALKAKLADLIAQITAALGSALVSECARSNDELADFMFDVLAQIADGK